MSEIFSYKKDRSTNVSHHWHSSSAFSPDDIDKIQDPNLDASSINITSIPSPFARLDLVWTAFKKCKDDIEGDTLYHKLVSEALDIAQILFTLEKFKGSKKLELVSWNQAKGLERLKNSSNSSHKLLGKTLAMYIEEDNKAYGFESFENFIFLKRGQEVVLGGLSPVTLFFSTAEAKNNTNLDIRLDRRDGTVHKVFDTITPLYQRSKVFQAYVLWLIDKVKSESKHPISKEFREYIQNNFKKLPESERTEISKEKESLSGKLKGLVIGANESVRMGDLSLQEYISDSKEIESQSDFVICSDKFDKKDELKKKYKFKPLILSPDFGELGFKYTTMQWKANEFNVPFRDPISDPSKIFERILPGTNDKYPYLSANDFFEDFIVKLPYKQNSNYFFVPKFDNQDSKDYSFLFPIKPTFFDFYDASELQEKLELRELSNGSIQAYLKIEIGKKERSQSILLSKLYFGSEIVSDLEKIPIREASEKKDGYVIENTFGFGIFPPVYQSNINPHFRILFIDNEQSMKSEYKLYFGENETCSLLTPNPEPPKTRLSKSENLKIESSYYVVEKNFDFIQISRGEGRVRSILLPKWINRIYNPGGTSEAIFAVDFGTTNTHIEGKIGEEDSQSFKYDLTEKQVATLNAESLAQDLSFIQAVFEKEFIPQEIGQDYFTNYPHRTVATRAKKLDAHVKKYAAADVLIGFTYGKMDVFEGIDEITDLKWRRKGPSTSDDDILELYLDQIAFMIRNKCLLGNINLSSVKFAITYPSSMNTNQKNRILDSWKENYAKYFLKEGSKDSVTNVFEISESIAPYYSFPGTTDNENPTVNIDIGGGTTDVVAFRSGKPLASTSFRFAATSLFGAGIPETEYSVNANNGYVKKYLSLTSEKLQSNGKGNFIEIQKRIAQKNQASLLIDFWLSLVSQPGMDGIVPFLKEMSRPGNHKAPLLLFYASVIYYVGLFAKSLEDISPRDITFSGMGSKVLNLLTSNSETLNELTKVILKFVYKDYFESNPNKLSLVKVRRETERPKEITAKGAVKFVEKSQKDIPSMKALNRCYLGTLPFSEGTKDDEILMYQHIEKSHPAFQKAVADVKDFYLFFFDTLPTLFDIEDHFGIEKTYLAKFKDIAIEDVVENSLKGLTQKKSEESPDRKIEETLFFYPITVMVNRMGSD